MLQKSSKTVLIAGFLVGFIIMLLLTIGSSHIGRAHARQLQEISGDNTHAYILSQMRDAALKRTNLLLQMILSDDTFARDDLFLRMKEEAVLFIMARDHFLGLPDLTPYEKDTWEEVAKIIATNSIVQNEAATLLIEGSDELAREALNTQILEANAAILDILNGMLVYQGVEISNLIDKTVENRNTTNMYLNILAIVGVLSFLVVAFIVYRLVIVNEERIRKASREANKANHAKSSFLANMSHEMRTPLTAILGFSEQLAEKKSIDNDCYEAVTHIKTNCDHLRNMVNDILDLSKIEAGQLIIEYQDLSVTPFLEDIRATFNQLAQQKDLIFELNIELPIPFKIKTDEVRLKQILINLINNAIKFTHQGKITLNIHYDETKRSLYFSVVDTGIGMESNYLKQLFVPY
ncbi:MAG: ATP-binding protein, partial [Gammaproteobacteria bacterium]|nr:ATP-binding protein [Gammaproteobacteria bacterium]